MLGTVHCPACKSEFSIEEEHVGENFECPSCSCVFQTNFDHMNGFITTTLHSTQFFELPNPESILFSDENALEAAAIAALAAGDVEDTDTDCSTNSRTIPASLHHQIELSLADRAALQGLIGMDRYQNLNLAKAFEALTATNIRRVIQYFKLRYKGIILDAKGKKKEMTDKLIDYLSSPMYKDAVRAMSRTAVVVDDVTFTAETPTPTMTPASISVRSSKPMEVSSTPVPGSTVLVTCPSCLSDLNVQIKEPDQHFPCPECTATFALNVNPKPDGGGHCSTASSSPDVVFFDGQLDEHLSDMKNFTLTFSDVATGSPEYMFLMRRHALADPTVAPKERHGCKLMQYLGFGQAESIYALRRSGNHVPRALVFCLVCLDGGEFLRSYEVGLLQANRSLKAKSELGSYDRTLFSQLVSRSFLLDPELGCRVLQNILFLLGDLRPLLPEGSDVARQKMCSLIYRLLQLEEQLILRYADTGCFYMKKVALELEQAIVVRASDRDDKKQVYEIPAIALQREIQKLDELLYPQLPQLPTSLLPKQLVYGYVVGKPHE